MESIDTILGFFSSPMFYLGVRLMLLFIAALYLALVYWTYRDAKKRGALAFYWALIVLVSNFFGWIVYLIVRPPEFVDDVRERDLEIREKESILRADLTCPSCSKPIEDEFLICPYCLRELRRNCQECQKPLKLTWRACPYCRSEVG